MSVILDQQELSSLHTPSHLYNASAIDDIDLDEGTPADDTNDISNDDGNADPNAGDAAADSSTALDPTSKGKGKGKGKGRGKGKSRPRTTGTGTKASKSKANLPGSTADFRRKEANRLAADRSRSRQAEKVTALETAVIALGEENLRLKEDIAKLESDQGVSSGGLGLGVGAGAAATIDPLLDADAETSASASASAGARAETTQQGTVLAAAAAPAASGSHEDHDAVEHGTLGQDEETEDQVHSRTILAALMSDADISQALEGDWMNLVNTQQEVIPHSHESTTGENGNSNQPSQTTNPVPPLSSSNNQNQNQTQTQTQTQNSLASVNLHAEMEKHLRDDLATTKASIARLEKAIANFGIWTGEEEPTEDPAATRSSLPDDILSDDSAILEAAITNAQAQKAEIQQRLPVLREVVSRMWDATNEEQTKLFEMANTAEVDENDREAIATALQSITGYISSMLGDRAEPTTNTPYSTPAIARRRRGRPPKTPLPIRHVFGKPRAQLRLSEVQSSAAAAALDEEEASRTAEAFLAQIGQGLLQASAASGSGTAHHSNNGQSQSNQPPQSQKGVPSHLEVDPDMYELSDHFAENQNQQHHHHHRHQAQDNSVHETDREMAGTRTKPLVTGGCAICNRTLTTVWRKINVDGVEKKVCNACGLYRHRFGVNRPLALWGDGQAIRKRRKTLNPNAYKKRKVEEEGKEDGGQAESTAMGGTGLSLDQGEGQDTQNELDSELLTGDEAEDDTGLAAIVGMAQAQARLQAQALAEADAHGQGQNTDQQELELQLGLTYPTNAAHHGGSSNIGVGSGGNNGEMGMGMGIGMGMEDTLRRQEEDEEALRQVARSVANAFGTG